MCGMLMRVQQAIVPAAKRSSHPNVAIQKFVCSSRAA